MRGIGLILTLMATALPLNLSPATRGANQIPTAIPDSSFTIHSHSQPTTAPSLSVADAVQTLNESRSRCIARLQNDENYRAAVAAEKDAEQRRANASDDDRADAALQLLAARAAVHRIESAAFASDQEVVAAQKAVDAARVADALRRKEFAATKPAGNPKPLLAVAKDEGSRTSSNATIPAKDDWFVELDDTNNFYASPGVPESTLIALKNAQAGNVEIKSIAFTCTGNCFVLSGNGIDANNEAFAEYPKLKEWQQPDANAQCLAFAPTGPWIAILGSRGFWGPGSPAWVKIKALVTEPQDIRSVFLGPHDSYVILYGQTSISYSNVPDDLAKVLDGAVAENIAIQCVAFTGRDWICLSHDNWWTSNPNLPAAKTIDQKFKAGEHPKWIAFRPNLGPFDPQKFAAIIQASMAGKLAGGYACEAVDHGKVVVDLADGWARAPWEKNGSSIKFTTDKPIEIASVSKTITATALLKLWEETASMDRRFSLDEPFWPHLRAICPDAADDVKTITIRQVLMHRTGFAKTPGTPNLDSLRKLLILPLAHPPGTFYEYQNINYSIARFLIEQISGQDYTAYVRNHVLAPMGISDMQTHSEYQNPICYYTDPDKTESGDAGQIDLSATAGSYGWYASAADLAKFLEGLRQFTVLRPAATAMMFDENLGWDSGNPWIKGGLAFWSHGTVHSIIAYYPDGVEAVILLNCESPLPGMNWFVQAWKDAH